MPDGPPATRPGPRSSRLRPRHDAALALRMTRSVSAVHGVDPAATDLSCWLAERRRGHRFAIRRIAFADMDRWSFDGTTGDIVHDSGKFFSVGGLRVSVEPGTAAERTWHQPIINQPEVGIVGMLVKEFDGVLHFLVQAKMEPGNAGLIELAPTVQATRSNYSRVHGGQRVRYLDHFRGAGSGRVLVDVLQPELGSWLYRKVNRNMIVEAAGPVPEHPDFRWLTLGQIGALLRHDRVVNMNLGTVLSTAPVTPCGSLALEPDAGIRSWFIGELTRRDVEVRQVPLRGLPDWHLERFALSHSSGRYFDVVAVSARADNREVREWTQPLLEPRGRGVTGLLARRMDGVWHYLVHARVTGGSVWRVEIAPTVQYTPGNYAHLEPDAAPPFADTIQNAGPRQILYDAVQSYEGGRLLNAESRYRIVEADGSVDSDVPSAGYRWVTRDQLSRLVRHTDHVNVQARTLLAWLNLQPDTAVNGDPARA